MQVGLDRLRAAWNEHHVRAKTGRPGSGGRPSQRAAQRPHPQPQMTLPAGLDGVASWHAAGQNPLRLVPEHEAMRDRLHGNPQAQHARTAAVAAVLGSCAMAWDELLNGNYHRFVTAYLTYLSH